MEIFIDTVGKQFSLAIINNKKVVAFKSIKTERNTANNAVSWIKNFLEKNQVNILDIKGYYFTVGPGSFTGTKVGLNIVQSFELVNPTNNFYIINNFDLLRAHKQKVALEIGKEKYIVRNWFLGFYYDRTLPLAKINKLNTVTSCEKLTKKILENKIKNGNFKMLDNLSKVKLQYGNKFI